MAFERKDTDDLYDKAIKPLLKRKGIAPFRVDRSNRNDDIDDQILSELGRCDFVIADLTYARPSVYFEAGVAHGRPVPVIYTCRRDHFKHRADDQHGNFCVHFDLQMKPIIPWIDSTSNAFAKKLNSRIEHVVRPLLNRRQILQRAQDDRTSFASLSISEKLCRLDQCYQSAMKRHGFKAQEAEVLSHSPFRSMQIGEDRLFTKTLGRVLKVVMPKSYSTITNKQLYWAAFIPSVSVRSIILKQPMPLRLPKAAETVALCCVLQKVLVSRVAAALPKFKVAKTRFGYIARGEPILESATVSNYTYGKKARPAKQIPSVRHIHVICGIESESQFRAALNEHLQLAEQNQLVTTI